MLLRLARSELRKVLFLALSVTFLFVNQLSREPLNGFAQNSQGRRVWSHSDEFESQSQKSNVKVTRDKKKRHFGPFGVLLRFMFGKHL